MEVLSVQNQFQGHFGMIGSTKVRGKFHTKSIYSLFKYLVSSCYDLYRNIYCTMCTCWKSQILFHQKFLFWLYLIWKDDANMTDKRIISFVGVFSYHHRFPFICRHRVSESSRSFWHKFIFRLEKWVKKKLSIIWFQFYFFVSSGKCQKSICIYWYHGVLSVLEVYIARL